MSDHWEALRQAREMIEEQRQFIDAIMAEPSPVIHVLSVEGKEAVCLDPQGSTVILQIPQGSKVKSGMRVRSVGGALVPVDFPLPPIGMVEVALSDARPGTTGWYSVETGEGYRLADAKVGAGDRLVVSPHGTVIQNLGQEDTRFTIAAEGTGIRWADVGGQNAAKEALQEAVELPYKHRHLFAKYGKKPIKGVLLYGPPGCGKTLLAKATATALAATHAAENHGGFIYVRGPEILSKWVGQSEETVRSLFARAREFHRQNGYPAVLFIDEADAILGARGNGEHSHINNTLVPMFLAEMDGFFDSSVMTLLATNRPDTLDPAVVRDGRIDRKVYVGRPNQAEAEEIFQIYWRGKPLARDLDKSCVCEKSAAEVFSEERALYHITCKKGVRTFTLGDVASGALIESMVQQAVMRALRRDLGAGRETPTGVTAKDLADTANDLWRQNHRLNHTEPLQEFIAPFRGDVTKIERVEMR